MTYQMLLAHHDAAGASGLSDGAAQGENIRSGDESSIDGIHWRVGASMRHLCSVCLRRMAVTPSVV